MGKTFPLIAICGMDGSGKTTLAKECAEEFKAVYVHAHTYRNIFHAFAIRNHHPVVCDRYLYDKVARMIYYRIIPYWLAKFLLKIIPVPELTEVLTTPYVLKPEITDYKKWEEIYNFIKAETSTHGSAEILP